MVGTEKVFGIDFGTTNTRVAFYNGSELMMVPVSSDVVSSRLPSLIRYQKGQVVAIGDDATRTDRGVLPPGPLKWLLTTNDEVKIDGHTMSSVQVVADFFRALKQLVEAKMAPARMERVAITIPMTFSGNARKRLQAACKEANILSPQFFFEPVAAVYAGVLEDRPTGVVGVFDWGGGSLDMATVEIDNGIMFTRNTAGWKYGGTDFDQLICVAALEDFQRKNPLIGGFDTILFLGSEKGKALALAAEHAKIDLGKKGENDLHPIRLGQLLGGQNLSFDLKRSGFEEIIKPDVGRAEARMDRTCQATDAATNTLSRLYLSGGTCNIPYIRNRFQKALGSRLVSKLQLPPKLIGRRKEGLDDLGNATAIGAALLAVHGSQPIFGSDIGIRLAGSDGERFLPIFQANEVVDFKSREETLLITDASTGVARILVCERQAGQNSPGGRLLQIIPVPISRDQKTLTIRFTVGKNLVLVVQAEGMGHAPESDSGWIQHLNLGFRLPASVGANTPVTRA